MDVLKRKKRNWFIRKVSAWILCLCMGSTLLPAAALGAYAAEEEESGMTLSVYGQYLVGTEMYEDSQGDSYEVPVLGRVLREDQTALFVPDEGSGAITVSENGVARLDMDDYDLRNRQLGCRVQIQVTDLEVTQCTGMLTVPIPDGYSTERSPIIGEEMILPASHTDTTATYPVTLSGSDGWLMTSFGIRLKHEVTQERLAPVTLPMFVYDAKEQDYVADSSGKTAAFQPEDALFVNDEEIQNSQYAYVNIKDLESYDAPSGFHSRKKYSLRLPLDWVDEGDNNQPRKGTLTLPISPEYDGNKSVLTFDGDEEGIRAASATADTATFEVELPWSYFSNGLYADFTVDSKKATVYTNSVKMPLQFYPHNYGDEEQTTQLNVGTSLTLNTEEKFDFYVDETTRGASASVVDLQAYGGEQEQQPDLEYEDPFKDFVFLESGYDLLLSYDVSAVMDSSEHTFNEEIAHNGTITLPIPEGYEARSAKVTVLQNYVQMETNPLQAATSYTDRTVTFPISFKYSNSWSNNDGGLYFWCYVEFKKAHAHIYGNTYKFDAANHWRECAVCGEADQSAAHTWNDGAVTVAATTTAEGVKTYTCTVCGATKNEVLARLSSDSQTPGGAAGDSTGESAGDTAEDQADEEDLPAVGTKAADSSGTASYKVTSTEDGDVEVQYVAAKKKKKKVTIPASVTLEDGTEAKVTSVAKGAFKNNKIVTTVTIGGNVETVANGAFQGAKNLKTVTIGKNVKSIGSNAFKNCTSLTNVTISSVKLTSVGKNAFKGIRSTATVKVPKAKYSAYKKLLNKSGLPSRARVKKK